MSRRKYSLHRQLLTWLLLLLTPLLVIGAVNSYFWAYYFSNLAYDRSLFRIALALADQVELIDSRVEVSLPRKALELLEYDKSDKVYYRVTDVKGHTVAGDTRLPLPAVIPDRGTHLFYDSVFQQKAVRIAAFSISAETPLSKQVALVQIAETKTKRDRLAREIIVSMMLPQLLILLIAGLMVYFGIKRGLAPLDRLRWVIEQRSSRDLSAVPVKGTPREVQPLLHAMNDLLQSLRESIIRQQRFTADASHQLRTPLAGLQAQAEMALRESDPVLIRQALEWIRVGTLRLSHLVKQLLVLARVEPRSGREMNMKLLNLVELVRDVTSEWVSVGLDKHIELGFEATRSQVMIKGNDMMLREVLANLLDNAICYSSPGGIVNVAVNVNETHVQVIVEDNGPGIHENARKRIFERFYRLPESTGDNCGLGLAIVHTICLAHQAKIKVTKAKNDSGTCIIVTFLLAPIA